MRLLVNDDSLTLVGAPGIVDLLEYLCCHQPGTALAVNQQIISRDRWSDYYLQEGDEVMIFQAIAGG